MTAENRVEMLLDKNRLVGEEDVTVTDDGVVEVTVIDRTLTFPGSERHPDHHLVKTMDKLVCEAFWDQQPVEGEEGGDNE